MPTIGTYRVQDIGEFHCQFGEPKMERRNANWFSRRIVQLKLKNQSQLVSKKKILSKVLKLEI
jgi:hypothetical protein